ncbi:uncharacterized protein AC631_05809 [Debaryomyces fabryi]|uniref:Uncharacterized protein n=1 Tax=Debaryomyces fabryi TaxID=58627 RepID=A0A0V1PQK0_9ASCO|nr:uncharacterized protein AC631_05809 [Debaryomyces fabryi]KRZ98431.1 hypothetical protein AC631_05809 [Debaryomyces fabryi]CUM45788.1 unnamed protein product [Debaryomyces fabryi]
MCGTGRSCYRRIELLGVVCLKGPDIQTIGKTLGSGYVTVAGILISPKVKEAFVERSGTIAGAQTYHQHSFKCCVALAVQKKNPKVRFKT